MAILQPRGLAIRGGLQPRGLSPRGGDASEGPAWPPPLDDNLVHGWDFRSTKYLTLDGANINAALDRVGSTHLSNTLTARPTWGEGVGAFFDGVNDTLLSDSPVTLVGDHSFYWLTKNSGSICRIFYEDSPLNSSATLQTATRWEVYVNNAAKSFAAFTAPNFNIWRTAGFVHDKGSVPKTLCHEGSGATVWQGDLGVVAQADNFTFDRMVDTDGSTIYMSHALIYSVAHTQSQAEEVIAWMLENIL